MEKKTKKILVIITMIIILVFSSAISNIHQQNNSANEKFNNGVPIVISFTSMNYETVETEIKNKINNNWPDLENKIENSVSKSNNANSWSNYSYEIGSTSFDEGYETWNYYVFIIKYSELSVDNLKNTDGGYYNSTTDRYAYIIINKNNEITHLHI